MHLFLDPNKELMTMTIQHKISGLWSSSSEKVLKGESDREKSTLSLCLLWYIFISIELKQCTLS